MLIHRKYRVLASYLAAALVAAPTLAQNDQPPAVKPASHASNAEDFANESLVIEKNVEKIAFANDGNYTDEQSKRIRVRQRRACRRQA